jgi:hypothetical protein
VDFELTEEIEVMLALVERRSPRRKVRQTGLWAPNAR